MSIHDVTKCVHSKQSNIKSLHLFFMGDFLSRCKWMLFKSNKNVSDMNHKWHSFKWNVIHQNFELSQASCAPSLRLLQRGSLEREFSPIGKFKGLLGENPGLGWKLTLPPHGAQVGGVYSFPLRFGKPIYNPLIGINGGKCQFFRMGEFKWVAGENCSQVGIKHPRTWPLGHQVSLHSQLTSAMRDKVKKRAVCEPAWHGLD